MGLEYTNLEWEKVIRTIEALQKRVDARFPKSGISSVCGGLLEFAQTTGEHANWVARPLYKLRIGVGIMIALFCTLFGLAPFYIHASSEEVSWVDWITVLDAGFNSVIVLGAGALFLVTVETRIKRARALKAMHALRSLAHVIDMHQLTKDPSRVWGTEPTSVSPKLNLTPFELTRYLDYCSEMLALIGKVAALYIERFHDPVVLATANEVEILATGLSRKIWQKLMIIYQVQADKPESQPK
jgi:hypothetical protein